MKVDEIQIDEIKPVKYTTQIICGQLCFVELRRWPSSSSFLTFNKGVRPQVGYVTPSADKKEASRKCPEVNSHSTWFEAQSSLRKPENSVARAEKQNPEKNIVLKHDVVNSSVIPLRTNKDALKKQQSQRLIQTDQKTGSCQHYDLESEKSSKRPVLPLKG